MLSMRLLVQLYVGEGASKKDAKMHCNFCHNLSHALCVSKATRCLTLASPTQRVSRDEEGLRHTLNMIFKRFTVTQGWQSGRRHVG